MPRQCNFYVKDLNECANAYCYYPKAMKEIECPARGYMVARHGDWEERYKSVPGSKTQ